MHSISASDIVRRIRLENPWWEDGHTVNEARRRFKPRAYFEIFLPLVRDRSVRRAVVLMGPRRVGKTFMIHHAIQALIEGGVAPKRVGYFSVDNPIYNGLSLDHLLGYYVQASGVDYNTEETYIFFDEIQYLRDWEVHLKSLVDAVPSIKAIVSGSAAAALKLRSEESGAGRFTDFLLPPLTFHEYMNLLDKADLVVMPDQTQKKQGGPGLYGTTADIDQLNERFLHYLNFGGYPEVIFSEHIQSDPARFIKSDIIDKVLLRDLPSLYGIQDIQELNYLFTTLAFNTASEISLGGLSQNSGVAKNTIKKYIEYLEAAFLIKIVHRVDRNAKRFRRANFFKVYLTNPSMRAALFSPAAADDGTVIGALAETAIFSQWFHTETTTIYYARWDDGDDGEIDMVTLGDKQKPSWACEVKWSDRYCDEPHKLRRVVSFCKRNGLKNTLVTSKTKTTECTVDEVKIRFVPASLYCYTVGYNLVHGRAQRMAIR